jgi:hypothetical protein
MTIIKPPDCVRLVPEPPETDASFSMTGTAVLTVEGIMSGTVSVRAEAVDGLPPCLLELSGDPELMRAAYQAELVHLELIGLKIFTHVAGQIKESGSILVEAHPLFQAMANCLEARNCD